MLRLLRWAKGPTGIRTRVSRFRVSRHNQLDYGTESGNMKHPQRDSNSQSPDTTRPLQEIDSSNLPGTGDAGMATPDHTPHGRGYMTALHYYHHANDYYTSVTNDCSGVGVVDLCKLHDIAGI